MAWSTIRKATQEDMKALAAAAERFCKRHGIDYEDLGPESSIDFTLSLARDSSYERMDQARRLRPLWRRIVRRVLGHRWAEGIAYGYVGFSVK